MYASYAFTISDSLVIHHRYVYSILQFMEDLGGLFGIIYLLGIVLNFLLTTKNPAIDYLQYYYRVNEEDLNFNFGFKEV